MAGIGEKIVIPYSEVNARYIKELGLGKPVTMESIRKTLYNEKLATIKSNAQDQMQMLEDYKKAQGEDGGGELGGGVYDNYVDPVKLSIHLLY